MIVEIETPQGNLVGSISFRSMCTSATYLCISYDKGNGSASIGIHHLAMTLSDNDARNDTQNMELGQS